jgi:hypothetical protein
LDSELHTKRAKIWRCLRESRNHRPIDSPFLAQFRPSLTEVSHIAWRGAPLEMTGVTKGGAQRACSYRPRCDWVVAPWPRPQSTTYYRHTTDHNCLTVHLHPIAHRGCRCVLCEYAKLPCDTASLQLNPAICRLSAIWHIHCCCYFPHCRLTWRLRATRTRAEAT